MNTLPLSPFAHANAAFRNKDLESALALYDEAISQAKKPLKDQIHFNRQLTLRRLVITKHERASTAAEVKPERVVNDLEITTKYGQQPRRTDRSTVLLVGHALGKEIFGAENSFLDMINGLSDLGYNIIVALPNLNNQLFTEQVLKKSISIYIFGYQQWRENEPSELAVAAFCSIIVQQYVDVVHVNTIMIREPLLAARLLGVHSILHVRELITHDEHLCKVIGEEPEIIVNAVEKSADYLIANSAATAKCFSNSKRLSVVHNTLDADLFENVPKQKNDMPLRIGLISSNLPKKGIFDFIEVAKILEEKAPDISFVFVGPINDHIRRIQNEIKEERLPKTIKIIGYRETPSLAVAEADIVVNLSHFMESFGRTVLEAMAAARPVIVYDWGALPELVDDGQTGYIVQFRDTAAVAERIYVLYKNRIALQTMGKKAQIRARAVYGRTAYTNSLKSIYDSILVNSVPRIPGPTILRARSLSGQISRDKLKIAYFCWHFPVMSETFVLNELRILVERGYDVRVYCRQSPDKNFRPDFPVEWEQVATPEIFAKALVRDGRVIVHSHFVYPTVTDMVWPACEMAKIPFTFIAHAQDIFRYDNDAVNRVGEVARSALCKQVFVPSAFHRNYLVDRGVPDNKITNNPNGVDPALYTEAKILERKYRKFRRILAVHRFTEKKGLIYLIRAAALLRYDQVHIDIYGYGDLEESYRLEIERLGIDNVTLYGPIKGRVALLNVFRTCDLFVCPSVRATNGDMDGIPTVLMEAMAAGLPVLTTDLSGIPDLVQEGITGFISEPTSEGLASKIRYFYALPNEAIAAVIEDAASHVLRNFNSTTLVDDLLRRWTNEMVDVMIVSYNNLTETSEVINRLYKYTSQPFHLIVCDNGSSPSSLAQLVRLYDEHDNFTLILNHENTYVGPGTNLCLDHGSSEYAIYVCGKEGMVTNYGWEKDIVRTMNSDVTVGLAGTIGYSPKYLFGQDYPTGIPLYGDFRNPEFAQNNPNREFGHVQGGFFVLRRKMYESIGGFSNIINHNYTDVEYSYYVESCGWRLGEISSIMALYNKTRPELLQRIDETHTALHPPILDQLPYLDLITRRKIRLCNICAAIHDAFEGGDEQAICYKCSSTRRARAIFRLLAESRFLYRRIPAIGVNIPSALVAFWSEQFQGKLFSNTEFQDAILKNYRLEYPDNRFSFILINNDDGFSNNAEVAKELFRITAPSGTVILTNNFEINTLSIALKNTGFVLQKTIRFSSAVIRFDWNNFNIFCKSGSNA